MKEYSSLFDIPVRRYFGRYNSRYIYLIRISISCMQISRHRSLMSVVASVRPTPFPCIRLKKNLRRDLRAKCLRLKMHPPVLVHAPSQLQGSNAMSYTNLSLRNTSIGAPCCCSSCSSINGTINVMFASLPRPNPARRP